MSETVIVNLVRPGFYLDSVALMRIATRLRALPDVHDASLMIGTEANKRILDEAGLLSENAMQAGPNDLIIGLRVASDEAATIVTAEALAALERSSPAHAARADFRPRSLAGALKVLPEANLALISVPGELAVREARRALAHGLNVMLFSDNVRLEDEISLKRFAIERGLMMMGPDCGSAILGGVPIAFANVVPRGRIGVIAASGTGLQEFSSLVARAGGGLSHAIGVGGRDLCDAVAGCMTLAALDLLGADPATDRIVLISKPPGPRTAQGLLVRLTACPKPTIVCFIGVPPPSIAASMIATDTLKGAAEAALDIPDLFSDFASDTWATRALARLSPPRRWLRGLYSGGTLCAEAQWLTQGRRQAFRSNVPIPGAGGLHGAGADGHTLIDLGADEYTVGRPHPMIDPEVRNRHLRQALADPEVAVVLLDVVIGLGAHPDPGGEAARICAERDTTGPVVIASVCGTDGDPQGYTDQVRKLTAAGVITAPSNAQAAALAIRVLEEL